MASYGDVHRLFLQSMMSYRVLSENAALDKFQKAYLAIKAEAEDDVTLDEMMHAASQINRKTKSLNMELRIGICERSATRYLMLVNTVSTPINLTMTKYTENELEFFKKIVEEIVGSDDGRVSSIVCLNITDIPNSSKSENESLIRKFVHDMWLVDNEGKLSLSVRSISELDTFLKKTYKEYLLNCVLCKELIFQGFHCEQCPAVGHLHCFQAYAKRNRNSENVKCPASGCKAILPNLAGFLDESVEERTEPPQKKVRNGRN